MTESATPWRTSARSSAVMFLNDSVALRIPAMREIALPSADLACSAIRCLYGILATRARARIVFLLVEYSPGCFFAAMGGGGAWVDMVTKPTGVLARRLDCSRELTTVDSSAQQCARDWDGVCERVEERITGVKPEVKPGELCVEGYGPSGGCVHNVTRLELCAHM